MITGLTLIRRTILKENRLQIVYTDVMDDTTGIGGTWTGGGTYLDVFIVDGFIVLQSVGKMQPLMVCKNLNEVTERLHQKTGCYLSFEPSLGTEFITSTTS